MSLRHSAALQPLGTHMSPLGAHADDDAEADEASHYRALLHVSSPFHQPVRPSALLEAVREPAAVRGDAELGALRPQMG